MLVASLAATESSAATITLNATADHAGLIRNQGSNVAQ